MRWQIEAAGIVGKLVIEGIYFVQRIPVNQNFTTAAKNRVVEIGTRTVPIDDAIIRLLDARFYLLVALLASTLINAHRYV